MLDEHHNDEAEFQRLTEAAAGGDRAALDALLERSLPDLRAFVRLKAGALVRRHEGQSDIVQSVCREVLTHAERFQHSSEGAFRRWLFSTTLRKLSNRRDHLLAQRRDVGREVGNAEVAMLGAYARIASPSGQAVVAEELERIEAAMSTLDEDDRTLVVLARIVGLSRTEIADDLGLTPGAVRTRLHRALAKLAIALGE